MTHADRIHEYGLAVTRAVSMLLEETRRAGPLANWRSVVVLTQRHLWALNVVDGTTRGNRIIGELILKMATGEADPDYRNGAKPWCGLYAQALYRSAGFNHEITLASAGKVALVYGPYNARALKGSPAWAVDRTTGEVATIRDLHEVYGALRQIGKPGELIPEMGDLLTHHNSPGDWNGHVMTVGDYCAELGKVLIWEGNHSATMGPDGKIRDGVGTRYLGIHDPYLHFVIKPSPLDFAPWVSYHPTKATAETEAKLQTDEDRADALASQEGSARTQPAVLEI